MATENGSNSDLGGYIQRTLGCQVFDDNSGSANIVRHQITQLSPDIGGRRLSEYVADFYGDQGYKVFSLVPGRSLEVKKDRARYVVTMDLTQNGGVLDIRNLRVAAA